MGIRSISKEERIAAPVCAPVSNDRAQKFWAPQQDHPTLRKRDKKCSGKRRAVREAGPYGSNPRQKAVRGGDYRPAAA